MERDFIPIAQDSDQESCDLELETYYGRKECLWISEKSLYNDTSDVDQHEALQTKQHFHIEISSTFYCTVHDYQKCKICDSEKAAGCLLPCCQYNEFICFECLSRRFISTYTIKHNFPSFVLQMSVSSMLELLPTECPYCCSAIKARFKEKLQKNLQNLIITQLSVPKSAQ
jgi:hypothetical protein